MPQSSQPTYFAFISYSHSDEEWAGWLHKKIETYRIPGRLRSEYQERNLPTKLFPVFRDREELPTSADLGANIRNALESSRFLIVICSPRSAQSRWVEEEVVQFKALHGINRVLCLIVDGEPHSPNPTEECFSDALKFRVTADGQITDEITEPIAADARPGKDGRRDAFLKVMAGLLGVRYDSLKRRDRSRSIRNRVFGATVTAAVLLIIGLLANQWRTQKFLAEQSALQESANVAVSRTIGGDHARGISELHGILEQAGDNPAFAGYQTFYRAWIDRFTPLKSRLGELPNPLLLQWRSGSYFLSGERQVLALPQGKSIVTGMEKETGFLYHLAETGDGNATASQIDSISGKVINRIESVVLLDVAQLYRGPGSSGVLLAGKKQSASAGGATLTVVELDFSAKRIKRFSDADLIEFTRSFANLTNITLPKKNLEFPSLKPEREYWTLDPSPDRFTETAPTWHAWLPTSSADVADPVQRLFDAADWSGRETHFDSFFEFETEQYDKRLTVAAMGAQGVQYGVWNIFQVEQNGLKVSRQLSVEFHGDFGEFLKSPCGRFGYIQNLRYLHCPTFDIVDLERIELVSPKKQPPGAGAISPRVSFASDSSRFAMIAEDGSLWTYRTNNKGTFELINTRNLRDPDDIVAIAFLSPDRLTVLRADKTIQCIDPETSGQHWSTTVPGITLNEEVMVQGNATGTVFGLFDGMTVQLFQGETGAPLSDPVNLDELVKLTGELDPTQWRLLPPGESQHWRMSDSNTGQTWIRSFPDQNDTIESLQELTGFTSGIPPQPLKVLPGGR